MYTLKQILMAFIDFLLFRKTPWRSPNCEAPPTYKGEIMFVILREPMKSETLHTFAVNVSLEDAKGRSPYFPTAPKRLLT